MTWLGASLTWKQVDPTHGVEESNERKTIDVQLKLQGGATNLPE